MKERPILMSAPMVRALLRKENPKMQTRRVVKQQPKHLSPVKPYLRPNGDWCWVLAATGMGSGGTEDGFVCPYGQPGDRLWVRETFLHTKAEYEYSVSTSVPYLKADTVYAADYEGGVKYCGFTPSIFMPRQLSRITLEITDVRVQRLHDISEEDAKAEGVSLDCPVGHIPSYQSAPYTYCFAQLWDSIDGEKHPWESNAFVWALSFQRVQ